MPAALLFLYVYIFLIFAQNIDCVPTIHTCDELKRSFREIFLSFQGGF